MAVVSSWTELSPARELGSFMDNVLSLSQNLQKESGYHPAYLQLRLWESREQQSCTKYLFLEGDTPLALRLLPDGRLHRGILLESEARRV